MKVTTISANIRYSQDTGHGAWKVIELGAEATIDAKDSWQQAQQQLYGELSQQLQKMWANGKTAQNGHGSAGDSSKASEPSQAPEHWCQAHQTEFKRYERQGKVWYSHKTGSGARRSNRLTRGKKKSP